jgi:hypothetical protein
MDVVGSSFWDSLADYLADFVADRAAAMAFPPDADEGNTEERQRVPLDAADGDEKSPPMDSTAQEFPRLDALCQGFRPERRSDGQNGWSYRGKLG